MPISIYDIKRQADLTCQNYFKHIYFIFIAVNTISVLIQMIPNGLIAIGLGFLTTTLSHAYVIVSMKLVRKEPEEISRKDIWIGLKSFQKIFPAYLMRKVVLAFISIMIVLPAFSLIRLKTGLSFSVFIDWVKIFIVGGMESSLSWIAQDLAMSSIFLLFSSIIAVIVTAVFSYGFSLVPYLLETYDISWNEALMKSWKLMDGHKRQLLQLQILYFPRMIMTNLMTNLFINLSLISFVFLPLAIFLFIYGPAMLWLPQLQVANALFFEILKVDDETANENQLFQI